MQLGEALVPGAVGVAAGEVGQGSAGLEEPGVGAAPDGEVTQSLGDVALAYSDGAVEDDGLAGVEPAQGGEVADLGGGQLRAGGEVEAFEGDLLVEPGLAEPSGDGGGLAAGDLVFAQDLEELDVAEFAGAGLGEPGLEGVQHPGQPQDAQGLVERAGLDRGDHGRRGGRGRGEGGHDALPSAPALIGTTFPAANGPAANRASGPCRNAAAPPSPAGVVTGSASVPAVRMPLTVR